jgi:hypothetical protein
VADAGGGAQDETGRSATARGGRARDAGAATMAALRRATARKVATLIRSDPENAATVGHVVNVGARVCEASSAPVPSN